MEFQSQNTPPLSPSTKYTPIPDAICYRLTFPPTADPPNDHSYSHTGTTPILGRAEREKCVAFTRLPEKEPKENAEEAKPKAVNPYRMYAKLADQGGAGEAEEEGGADRLSPQCED